MAVRVPAKRARRGNPIWVLLLVAVPTLLCWWSLAFASQALAYVYWANNSTGTIGRANLDGSGVNQSFIAGAGGPIAVAVDGAHIYWVNNRSNTIGRANLDGSGVNQSFITASLPIGLAVDGSYIYWTNTSTNYIGRANLNGSGVNQRFIYTGAPSNLQAIAVNATGIFWIAKEDLEIGRANLDGSGVIENWIRGGFCNPYGLAADSTHLYWADQYYADYCSLSGQGAIASANTVVGIPPRKLLLLTSKPVRLAVDGAHLYWSNGAGSIGRANLDGSGVNPTFVTGTSGSAGVAVDAGGPPPAGAPQLTNVTQSATSWHAGSALPRTASARPPVGTTFGFTLDRPARVRFVFSYRTVGRHVRAAFSRAANAGRTRIRFEGRLDLKRKLPPGRYRLTIVATANGRHSRPAVLSFTILP
jgi:Low-density lipoprotein receptor repeat class B